MSRRVGIALVIVAAFLAAVVGVAAGRLWFAPPSAPGAALHALLHDGLDLDAGQKAQIETLERDFARRRVALEAEMKADNARLATAIEAEHALGPQVTAAIDANHRAMGTLQKATLDHIFGMRAVLRPDQARRFDAAVGKALTDGGR
ncbi:periplasmic heavy metal sensor [Sphingomonas donggukensis]|uniref:Periplasmic heavy metal sensor n=1 Tax=Sphingomonas donggukensis TaxID=2949093 RepID=A0ABY4TR57_9SPHN|nr:periplasmic heavy metal sensor [Sphingomonas donggukensis]URW74855.1 periplasmic heavy metal sensor [Sphingomonas donggukensis]